ncbi:uncharacterized protein OCT59_030169 [Rhizophagus irregularis]|uniref:uncharacterized protein n=1 Tax=Rhizophagus irregularis TaxID=588596 RepID=UPI0033236591|nr:hypothetical protein OCT59_030169 [Rhizophagus irregularis]
MDKDKHNETYVSNILNDQLEGIMSDESNIDIKVGTSFSTWEDAEIKLNQYAKFAGFSLRRKRVESDNNRIVRRRTFECSFLGKSISNQIIDITHQRQRSSRKIMCPWHINLTMPKSSTEARCYQTKCCTAGIQSTQRVEVMNHLIKEGTGSTTSLCNLHIQIQKLLDNEAQWARHNAYLQSLSTNQAPSIIEPIFPKVVELMKKYLTPHILSVQQQQILGSLLYRAKIISKESIDTIKDDDQCNYNEGFLEDHLDRPQTSLFFLLEEIELSDIIEIWELYGLTKSYKHYIILLIDGEDIQDQYIQANLQDETVGIVTQFQQNDNNTALVTDLHIFKQLRIPDVFTNNIKQCLQRKVKYAYGFGKMKKALNLALDLGCENEIIDMINKFINCKKNIIKDANNDENNEENLQILDPIVQKRRGRPPNKRIKSASETNSRHVSTKNSAINPSDPNLYVREVQQHPQQASSSRTPFNVLDTNTSSDFNTQRQERSENTSNRKTYICKVCGEPGHNARTCNKQNQ